MLINSFDTYKCEQKEKHQQFEEQIKDLIHYKEKSCNLEKVLQVQIKT